MKILYILPLVWMLVFTSCNSDFLDREPSNKYTDDILLTSTEGGMMLLNGTLRRTYPFLFLSVHSVPVSAD